MRICIFSDIHGNGLAFEAAYPAILKEEADLNICLGDICGYYFDEIAIIRRLRTMPRLVVLKGNHDRMYAQAAGGDTAVRGEFLRRYGSSLEGFLKKDHRDTIDWLTNLPEYFMDAEHDLACYHASPWNHLEEYIYPDSDLGRFKDLSTGNIFLGHTHYPMSRMIGDKWVANPGSLGQPRAGGWPTYAVVDLPRREVEFKEVPYDKAALLERIESMGERKPYLREVLLREKKL